MYGAHMGCVYAANSELTEYGSTPSEWRWTLASWMYGAHMGCVQCNQCSADCTPSVEMDIHIICSTPSIIDVWSSYGVYMYMQPMLSCVSLRKGTFWKPSTLPWTVSEYCTCIYSWDHRIMGKRRRERENCHKYLSAKFFFLKAPSYSQHSSKFFN